MTTRFVDYTAGDDTAVQTATSRSLAHAVQDALGTDSRFDGWTVTAARAAWYDGPAAHVARTRVDGTFERVGVLATTGSGYYVHLATGDVATGAVDTVTTLFTEDDDVAVAQFTTLLSATV